MTALKYIASVKARAKVATPGPWESAPKFLPDRNGPDEYCVSVNDCQPCEKYSQWLGECPRQVELDSDFCAAARTDVDRLVAMVEAALKGLDAIMRFGTTGHGNTVEGERAYLTLAALDRIAAGEVGE